MAGCADRSAGQSGADLQTSGLPALATSEPSPTSSPLATAPEVVTASAPGVVDPGVPADVDGRQVLPPVGLGAAVSESGQGATVWLEDFTSVAQAGSVAGEVGGPAVQFDVLIHNDGSTPLDLSTLAVTASYGDQRTPAEDVVTGDSRPLVGMVEPGGTVRGTLVFVVPTDERADLLISVDLASDAQVIQFQGAAAQ